MIFVAFGNAPFSFTRLAEKVDELAVLMGEPVHVQCGHTDHTFRNAAATKFLDHSAMQKALSEASIVVSHGGCGIIVEALKLGKTVVAVPRLKGEHNHSQLELVEAMEKEGYLLAVYEIDDLGERINEARGFVPRPLKAGSAPRIIGDFIRGRFPGRIG